MAKDNTGIKSLLSIHSPRGVVVAKKQRPTVQEMLDSEDLMNKYDPYWWISDTPEVLLKPQETPKNKFGDTPAQKEKMIKDWIERPPSPYEKATKKKIVEDHYKYEPWANKKVERITKPTEDEKESKDFWAGYNDPSGKKMLSHVKSMNKKYAVTPQTPERKQKARTINTTREKTHGQV